MRCERGKKLEFKIVYSRGKRIQHKNRENGLNKKINSEMETKIIDRIYSSWLYTYECIFIGNIKDIDI